MGTTLSEPVSRKLVSVSEVAAATGLAEPTVRGMLDRGEWPGIKVGQRRTWRMSASVLDAILAGRDPSTLRT